MQITEPGKYLARAILDSVDFGEAKSGTEQFSVTFTILDATTQEPTDVQTQWIGSLANDKSLKIAARALRAMGWVGNDIYDLTGIDRNVVELDIQPDTYEGVTRLKVKWVNTPGVGVVFKNKLDDGKKKLAAARMAAFLAANPKDAAVVNGAGGAPGGGGSADNINFP